MIPADLVEGIPMNEACKNCRFFQFDLRWKDDKLCDDSRGSCRYMPPVPLEDSNSGRIDSVQPDVGAQCWCGRYEFGEPRPFIRKKLQ